MSSSTHQLKGATSASGDSSSSGESVSSSSSTQRNNHHHHHHHQQNHHTNTNHNHNVVHHVEGGAGGGGGGVVDDRTVTSPGWQSDLCRSVASSSSSLSKGIDAAREMCAEWLKSKSTHDLLPESSKVFVFDTRLTVGDVCGLFQTHGLTQGCLWSAGESKHVGMLHVSQIARLFRTSTNASDCSQLPVTQLLAQEETNSSGDVLVDRSCDVMYVRGDTCLASAVKKMRARAAVCACVMSCEGEDDMFLMVMQLPLVLRFMQSSLQYELEGQLTDRLDEHPSLLRVLDAGHASHLKVTAPAKTILHVTHTHHTITPVLDDHGMLVDVCREEDVLALCALLLKSDVSMTVGQFLKYSQEGASYSLTCFRSDSLWRVMTKFSSTGSNILICVTPHNMVEGVILLSDFLAILVSSSPKISGAFPEPLSTDELLDST